jgi:LuxR family glucitol operon transcriptional activator
MLKRAFRDQRKADSGTQYALTDVSSEYLARFAPPSAKTLEKVQAALKKLRSLAELAQVQEEAYPYDIFTVRSLTSDERICTVYLNSALKKARASLISEARELVEHAKNLLPNFSETYRISAIVEGKANDLFKADEEIRIAIDLNPASSLTHYQYALFLLKEMEDFNSALMQIDAALKCDSGNLTLETARGLILTRLGRYEEGAEIYERIISLIAEHPRRWRIATLDQAAECYRRWAEVDRVSRDPTRQMAHLERSREILDIALSANDFDSRTGAAYVNVVEDVIFAAVAAHDGDAILRWLSKLSDAGHLLTCPPFRTLSIDHFKAVFPDGGDVMETIQELTRSRSVMWRVESCDLADLHASESDGPKQFGLIKRIFTEEKFGFITDSEGRDRFFHSNSLLNQKQWDALVEGTRVGFAIGTNSKGPCAVNVYRA